MERHRQRRREMERHRERRREMERHIERRREMDRVHTDTSGIPSQTPKMAIRGMVMNGSSAHAWHPSLSLACSLSPLLSHTHTHTHTHTAVFQCVPQSTNSLYLQLSLSFLSLSLTHTNTHTHPLSCSKPSRPANSEWFREGPIRQLTAPSSSSSSLPVPRCYSESRLST